MQHIGASEAKNKLSNLLNQVEDGAEIVITRWGRQVARLTPVHELSRQAKAADRIRQRAKALKLGSFRWSDCKQYRDKGRP